MVTESGFIDPAPSTGQPPVPSDRGAFVRALVRCRGRAFLVGLGCAAVAIGACWLLLPPPSPVVTARLRFEPASSVARASLRRELTSLAHDPTVLAAVLRVPEIVSLATVRQANTPEDWLVSALQVEGPPGESHVALTLTGSRPSELAAVVNAVAEAVAREAVTRERQAREECAARAEADARSAQERARAARARLRDLLGAGDADSLALRHKLALEKRADAEKELRQTRNRKGVAETELAALRRRAEAPAALVPRPEGNEALAADDTLRRLAAERDRILREIEHLRGLALPGKTPPALERREELADIDRRIKARREQLAGPAAAPPAAGDAVAALERQVAALEGCEKGLADDVRRWDDECRSLAQTAKEADRLREAVTAADAAAARAETEANARAQERAAPPLAVREEWAQPPPSLTTRRAVATGLAALCGVLVVLFGYGWQEYKARRVHEAGEVALAGGLRLFGTLPDAPATVKRRLAGNSPKPGDPGTRQLNEALDAVRTPLLYEADGRGLSVVLVTSAVGGEGKTSLASQLAISLARAWRRTLLVDADLRRPAAHRLFGLPLEPGFSELLRGEAEVDHAFHATPISRLWALPAGFLSDHALQALAQDVGPLLADLKARFDFVVVDCAPVLSVADALMLGQHVDGVLLSVLRGSTRLPLLAEARERLQALGVPILGAVVAGVPGEAYTADDRGKGRKAKPPAA